MRALEPLLVRRLVGPPLGLGPTTRRSRPRPPIPRGILAHRRARGRPLLRAPPADLLDPGSARPTVPALRARRRESSRRATTSSSSKARAPSSGPLLIAAPRCPCRRPAGWGFFCPLYCALDRGRLGRRRTTGAWPSSAAAPGRPGGRSLRHPAPVPDVPRAAGRPEPVPARHPARLQRALRRPGRRPRAGRGRRGPPVARLAGLRRGRGRGPPVAARPLRGARAAAPVGAPAPRRRARRSAGPGSRCGTSPTPHPELEAYARFRAVGERHGRDRRRWPADGGGRARACRSRTRRCATTSARSGWPAGSSSAAAGPAPLYGDLPVGVHPDGFDPFSTPEAFAPAPTAAPRPTASSRPARTGRSRRCIRSVCASSGTATSSTSCGWRSRHVVGAAGRPRDGPAPSLLDPRGLRRPARRLRLLPGRRAARPGRPRGPPGRRRRGRRGPRARSTRSVREAMAHDRMLALLGLRVRHDDRRRPLPSPPRHCIASIGDPRHRPASPPSTAARRPGSRRPTGEPRLGRPDAERATVAGRARGAGAASGSSSGRSRSGPGRRAHPDPRQRAALAGCLAHLAGKPGRPRAGRHRRPAGRRRAGEPARHRCGGGPTGATGPPLTLEADPADDPEVAALLSVVDRDRPATAATRRGGLRPVTRPTAPRARSQPA